MNQTIEVITGHIKEKYRPSALIIYGSYADGTNGADSDFDALIISKEQDLLHDTSFVGGVQLDLFVYPEAYFSEEFDCEEFVQISDGKIIFDECGMGARLMARVRQYLEEVPAKTREEAADGIRWCEKMLHRGKRCDAEGMFRLHLLLTESLSIFCDAVHIAYSGPKKSLRYMQDKHPEAFEIYSDALRRFDEPSLEKWVEYLKRLI